MKSRHYSPPNDIVDAFELIGWSIERVEPVIAGAGTILWSVTVQRCDRTALIRLDWANPDCALKAIYDHARLLGA